MRFNGRMFINCLLRLALSLGIAHPLYLWFQISIWSHCSKPPSGPSLLSSLLASLTDVIILSESQPYCLSPPPFFKPKFDPHPLLFLYSHSMFGLTVQRDALCSGIAFTPSSLTEQTELRGCGLSQCQVHFLCSFKNMY